MKALILAAGYATRLYPLTKDYPKPLLRLGSRPIIDYIIDKLKNIDEIDEIIVVTNSRFIAHFRAWAPSLRINKRLSLVDDLTSSISDRRGAIGDIRYVIARKRIRDDLIVIGGDNVFQQDLQGFFSFVRKNRHDVAVGTFDIKNKRDSRKYGVIKLDRANRIVDFQEKPEKPKSTLIAMCLYYFPRKRLGLVKDYLDDKAHKHDATGLYIDWLARRIPVYGFVFRGHWYDIGDHKFYNQAKHLFANL